MLLRDILCGGVWNGFLLGQAKKEDVPCRVCGKRDGDGHFFWGCTFPLPSSTFRELPDFASSYVPGSQQVPPMSSDGMVGCLVLVALVIGDPWASSFGDLASFHLERGP